MELNMKILLGCILLGLMERVWAHIECPAEKIKYIQPEKDIIFIKLVGQQWQRLGSYDDKSINAKLSVALSAHATGKKVILRFPDGHDPNCGIFNSSVGSLMIRILDTNFGLLNKSVIGWVF
jgi:hypothetical protein